jgi:hypothetical protein
MIHTACEMRERLVNNFTLMLMVTASEYGEPTQYRFTREFKAIDTSDPEKLALILEHERTDFTYTKAIEIIEGATGCDDFKLGEMDAEDCEEGRDYHTMLDVQICNTELVLIYAPSADEIVIKTIDGGEHICAFTHDEKPEKKPDVFDRLNQLLEDDARIESLRLDARREWRKK